MKYFSEKLNQVFDTPEQLQEAELNAAKATKAKDTKKKVEKDPSAPVAPTKKQLATDVEQAEEALKKAYAEYELAKKNAQQLSEDYLAAIDALLEPAKKAVKAAEQAKYDAISRFNAEYGPYQVVYTGSKAADELVKAMDRINSRSRSIFDSLFWI